MEQVSRREDGRIDVRGPAEVVVNGGNRYKVQEGTNHDFPAQSEVWVKVWPEAKELERTDDDAPVGMSEALGILPGGFFSRLLYDHPDAR